MYDPAIKGTDYVHLIDRVAPGKRANP